MLGWLYRKTVGAAQRKKEETESRLRARWIDTREEFHRLRIPIGDELRRVKWCTLGIKVGVVLLWIIIGGLIGQFSGLIPLIFLVVVLLGHFVFRIFDRLGSILARWIWMGHGDLDPVRDKDVFNIEAELRAMQAAANMKIWESMDPETRRAYAPDLLASLHSLSSSKDFSTTWKEIEVLAQERLGGPTMPAVPALPAPKPEAGVTYGVVDAEIVNETPLAKEDRHEF